MTPLRILSLLLLLPGHVLAQDAGPPSPAPETPPVPAPVPEAPSAPAPASEPPSAPGADATDSEPANSATDSAPADPVADASDSDADDADLDTDAVDTDSQPADPVTDDADADLQEPEEERPAFSGSIQGTYQLRMQTMGELPLTPLPRDPLGATGSLGQRHWAEQWFRLRADVEFAPPLRLVAEIDVFDGLVFGDFTQGVGAAARPRNDATAFPGVEPRALYVEWQPSFARIQAGLMTSHWGLGILANDGAHEPPFGDYRQGDVVTRLLVGTRPLGPQSPFTVAVAGDLVFDDGLADIRDGDTALQAVLAAFYREDHHFIGAYGVVRHQTSEIDTGASPSGGVFDETLTAWVADVFATWDIAEPSGGRLFAALEALYIHGQTNAARTLAHPEHDIRQFMAVAQVGRRHHDLDVVFEFGYASGDSNTEDDTQRRATMKADHRVGLLLFPEVLAWQSARSATLAMSAVRSARPSPGSDLLPTDGGVAGALYLFPHATWRVNRWLDARIGAVWARASSDVVDPYRQRAESRSANYRGGASGNRDLGLELDAALRLRGDLSQGVSWNAGVEAAVLFPGHAFDDAAGRTMDPLGTARVRLGLTF